MIILQPTQIAKIENLIKEHSGIVLERVTSRNISSKIVEHMKQLGLFRFDDYMQILNSGGDEKPSLADLISELTISESSFFRNSGQFEYIYYKFLPELFAKKGNRHHIRIWSAGCAKGEEAYSLAMVARKFQMDHPGCEFQIFAGDINNKNLQLAREATYGERAFRNRIERFESLFDLKIGARDKSGNIRLDNEIKKLVSFRPLNLKKLQGLKCLAGSDIIFCRNVLIYFEEEFRRSLVKEFARLLTPGGLLCLGESECLPKDINSFELINHKNSYCYQKPTGKNMA